MKKIKQAAKAPFRRKTDFTTTEHEHSLHKVLNVRDLTFLGIAAIIGGGIFSSIGKACYDGGPGVIWLFIIVAIACGFAALCYAEFASRIPVAGSAYTYAYASFGELFAWIIGWALLMEYSIGNIYVAFSWSSYFTGLLDNCGFHMPRWLITDYSSAHKAFIESATDTQQLASDSCKAWKTAPQINGLRIIFDLPALFINLVITALVYIGIKESKNISNLLVILKILVIILIICTGIFYINTDNYVPFQPNGFGGIMAGVSAVFFTYIGFDAVSTMAEECKNPGRDLPRGMIYSLIVCTVLYVLISLVLTGMTKYSNLNVGDPLAKVLSLNGIKWLEWIVSVSAVIAMTSVLLVFQMGQPRIWMSMSRDGLLPKVFSKVHPKYKTPSFGTIVTGIIVGLPILFTNENAVLDFTSIGTLFAFTLVCGGVLLLPPKSKGSSGFRLPNIDGRFILPITIIVCFVAVYVNHNFFRTIFDFRSIQNNLKLSDVEIYNAISSKICLLVFYSAILFFNIWVWWKKLNLIPILGTLICLYLFSGMAASNWKWFFIWFLIGLIIYFVYGFRKSKLSVKK